MHIQFVGAVSGTLTGSCTWLYHKKSDTQFLVDCGMYQGESYSDIDNRKKFPFDPSQIKYVLLTHAHLDHCGLIPRLYREGFKGKVITTEATAELARLIMIDSAKILNPIENIKNLHGKKQRNNKNNKEEPIYTNKDIKKVQFMCVDENDQFRNKAFKIGHEISVTFLRNSHILGASSVQVTWESDGERESILFSGDIGCNFDGQEYLPLLKSNHRPHSLTKYLVVESTYGDRQRESKFKSSKNRLEDLTLAINETAKKGGKLIIPAFSLQRTQEIIFDLYTVFKNKNNSWDKAITTHCYSNLAQKMNNIYSSQLSKQVQPSGKYKYLNDYAVKLLNSGGTTISDVFSENLLINGHQVIQKQKYAHNDLGACDIIVASSGMCDAGPVHQIIKNIIEDEKNTVLLTGYVSPMSLGGRLKEASNSENKNITIDEKAYSLKAKIVDISSYYSAHADSKQLLDYIFAIDEEYYHPDKLSDFTVFINHGSDVSKKSFKEKIGRRSEKNIPGEKRVKEIIIAEKPDWFDLDKGCFDPFFNIQGNSTSDLTLSYLQKILENQETIIKDIEQIKVKLQIEEESESTSPIFTLIE